MTEATEAGKPMQRVRASEEGRARTFVRVAGVTAAVGIFLASAGDDGLARWLTLAGLILLVMALHRFGRHGADEPLEFDRG